MRSKVEKSVSDGMNMPLPALPGVEQSENIRGNINAAEFPSSRLRKRKILLISIFMLAGISIFSVALTRKGSLKTINKNNSVTASLPVNRVVQVYETPEPVVDKEKLARKDWSKLITVDHSNYAYGVLGGINNLSVIFQNKTNYSLEQVTAKITYIKANGKPWKTSFLTVYNLKPHSQEKQALPRVNRGKSVEVKIEKIVSKKMQFKYEAGKKGAQKDDPYFFQ